MFSDWLEEVLSDDRGLAPDPRELAAAETALAQYAALFAVEPPLSMRSKILEKIALLPHFPWLKPTDLLADWAQKVAHVPVPEQVADTHLVLLEEDDDRALFVAWVKDGVPLEVHDDLVESYLLLEGSCTCEIHRCDGRLETVHLSAGQYLSVAIGEAHTLVVTSPKPIKAILQWHKMPLAA